MLHIYVCIYIYIFIYLRTHCIDVLMHASMYFPCLDQADRRVSEQELGIVHLAP